MNKHSSHISGVRQIVNLHRTAPFFDGGFRKSYRIDFPTPVSYLKTTSGEGRWFPQKVYGKGSIGLKGYYNK